MFKRKIEKNLYEYYADKNAKILVLNGARQVGKSFIVRETAKTVFPHYIEINLKDDQEGPGSYSQIRTISEFYLQVSADYGYDLGNADDTIIFLDEIQVYPRLLTLLKALKADNRYRYITSGSLLGITLKHTFIPMGSIDEVKMYPMDFEEYLLADGTGQEVIDYLRTCFLNKEKVAEGIHETILRKFKEFLISGGLPDAVKAFIEEKNVYKTRQTQQQILEFYKDDASQYDLEHSLKIRRLFDLMPSYMENKVKRVTFKNIEDKDNAAYERYQDEFDYLINSGCALGTKAVADPRFPLDVSQTKNLIKLYYNDVGILSNILYKTNISAILNTDSGVNLGSVYETVVAGELIAHGHQLYYFDNKKTGEVDFLINNYESLSVLPIEIKSGKNQYNYRALPKLVDSQGGYKLPAGYVFGNDNYSQTSENIFVFPIYMVMFV